MKINGFLAQQLKHMNVNIEDLFPEEEESQEQTGVQVKKGEKHTSNEMSVAPDVTTNVTGASGQSFSSPEPTETLVSPRVKHTTPRSQTEQTEQTDYRDSGKVSSKQRIKQMFSQVASFFTKKLSRSPSRPN